MPWALRDISPSAATAWASANSRRSVGRRVFAEVERDLISESTPEDLARAKSSGSSRETPTEAEIQLHEHPSRQGSDKLGGHPLNAGGLAAGQPCDADVAVPGRVESKRWAHDPPRATGRCRFHDACAPVVLWQTCRPPPRVPRLQLQTGFPQ